MAIRREAKKEALLIVDAQVGVLQNSWNAGRVIKNIAAPNVVGNPPL